MRRPRRHGSPCRHHGKAAVAHGQKDQHAVAVRGVGHAEPLEDARGIAHRIFAAARLHMHADLPGSHLSLFDERPAMNIDPALSALADRLEKAYSGAVYDVMRARGCPNCVLPNTLRPLDPGRKLAGVVYTVSGSRRDNLDAHQTLLSWTALLSKAPRDSVVVCQPNDSELAHMGELRARRLSTAAYAATSSTAAAATATSS